MTSAGVVSEVAEERARQDEKWGEQNHPDGWTAPFALMMEQGLDVRDDALATELADIFRARADALAEQGIITWADILLEEVFEALGEAGAPVRDPSRLRGELIQVAAVAVAWVEAIDRRQEQ